MKRKLLLFLAAATLLPLSMVGHARADIPGRSAFIWNIRATGIWRTEYRTREIARWYQHYEWKLIQKIWLTRRAEEIWVKKETLKSFSCHRHCVYKFPDGRVWRIWRWYRKVDVRQFWAHYRTGWIGHGNPLIANVPEVGNRYFMNLDELVMTLPMTPADPDPGTPLENESVMIVDENGVVHTGEINTGSLFDVQNLPDIQDNPLGFIMTTTSLSSALLPDPIDRINNNPKPLGPGMVQIKTCVGGNNDEGICENNADCLDGGGTCEETGPMVQWIIPQDVPQRVCEGSGVSCTENSDCPGSSCVVDHAPAALANQKHQGLIDTPTGIDGNELDLDQSLNPVQLYEWELQPNGEVRGAPPGEPDLIIGPPVDLDGDGLADGPIGAPIPLDPTVRQDLACVGGANDQLPCMVDAECTGGGSCEADVLDPNAKPVDIAIEEDDQPTAQELGIFNNLLEAAGLPPLAGPFELCIKKKRVRRIWSITRRVVLDCWYHHWSWWVLHHIRLTVSNNGHRVWLTKLAVQKFSSSHHHYVVGQPPVWRSLTLIDVRFFRACYRIFCPRADRIRVKIEELAVTVPVDPGDPNSDLMFITTESNENNLPPPDVRAGLVPDPLPVDENGVFVEEIDVATSTLDMGSGGTGIFDGDVSVLVPGDPPIDVAIVGNQDLANALHNNQLQLYCWSLDKDGNLLKDDVGDGTMLTLGPTPAIPMFQDDQGNSVDNPTMLAMEAGIPIPAVTVWGIVAMTLLTLVAGSIVYRRRALAARLA